MLSDTSLRGGEHVIGDFLAGSGEEHLKARIGNSLVVGKSSKCIHAYMHGYVI